jgi:hypothetical protein
MTKKLVIGAVLILFGILLYTNIKALSGGIVGLTKRGGGTEGCTCHGFDTTSAVRISYSGPNSVRRGDTVTYTLSMTGGPLVKGGIDIACGAGKVILSPQETGLQRLEAALGIFELTHNSPKLPVSDTVKWTFRYIAPLTGDFDTLFATGNSVDGSNGTSGDSWNFAPGKLINLTSTGIENNISQVSSFNLGYNYPNPFNPSTKIFYTLNKSGKVKLSVYDSRGNLAATLVNGFKKSGEHSSEFNAGSLSSGVYFSKIEFEGKSASRKMVLLK